MRYGRGALPSGFLPAFSVNTEAEAKALLAACCVRGGDGHYYARELMREQTLENLRAFTDKLRTRYQAMRAKC